MGHCLAAIMSSPVQMAAPCFFRLEQRAHQNFLSLFLPLYLTSLQLLPLILPLANRKFSQTASGGAIPINIHSQPESCFYQKSLFFPFRGAIVPGMDYVDIWAPRRGIPPPVLSKSKVKKSQHVMRTVQTHIRQSLKYRKQEFQKYNQQQPYNSDSPPNQATNPKGFSHWQMIKNLEEFLDYCKRF
jgi:hypothetical protein